MFSESLETLKIDNDDDDELSLSRYTMYGLIEFRIYGKWTWLRISIINEMKTLVFVLVAINTVIQDSTSFDIMINTFLFLFF